MLFNYSSIDETMKYTSIMTNGSLLDIELLSDNDKRKIIDLHPCLPKNNKMKYFLNCNSELFKCKCCYWWKINNTPSKNIYENMFNKNFYEFSLSLKEYNIFYFKDMIKHMDDDIIFLIIKHSKKNNIVEFIKSFSSINDKLISYLFNFWNGITDLLDIINNQLSNQNYVVLNELIHKSDLKENDLKYILRNIFRENTYNKYKNNLIHNILHRIDDIYLDDFNNLFDFYMKTEEGSCFYRNYFIRYIKNNKIELNIDHINKILMNNKKEFLQELFAIGYKVNHEVFCHLIENCSFLSTMDMKKNVIDGIVTIDTFNTIKNLSNVIEITKNILNNNLDFEIFLYFFNQQPLSYNVSHIYELIKYSIKIGISVENARIFYSILSNHYYKEVIINESHLKNTILFLKKYEMNNEMINVLSDNSIDKYLVVSSCIYSMNINEFKNIIEKISLPIDKKTLELALVTPNGKIIKHLLDSGISDVAKENFVEYVANFSTDHPYYRTYKLIEPKMNVKMFVLNLLFRNGANVKQLEKINDNILITFLFGLIRNDEFELFNKTILKIPKLLDINQKIILEYISSIKIKTESQYRMLRVMGLFGKYTICIKNNYDWLKCILGENKMSNLFIVKCALKENLFTLDKIRELLTMFMNKDDVDSFCFKLNHEKSNYLSDITIAFNSKIRKK